MIRVINCALVISLLIGCASVPKDAFKVTESSLNMRVMQSRVFETNDEVGLLSAGIGVLQDLGYSIDETEKDVGVVTASKTVDATSGGQVAAAIFVALLGGGNMAIDKEQKIRVSLITKPSREEGKFLARITFQRIVWNTNGQIARVETIDDPEVYKEFFAKLSKSVFLEAHSI